MSNEIECGSCGAQRATLHAKKSTLMPGIKLFLCTDCVENKYEPRWIIILVGRSDGGTSIVSEVIRAKRYIGNEITAKELVG